ncbi:MAG: ppx [Gemmatimonadetes bacterium]|nr:ppx [Gemmatimonadota bacterium]
MHRRIVWACLPRTRRASTQRMSRIQTSKTPSAASASTAGVAFPLRVGAIDVGSNAIRLLAGEFRDAGHFDTLAEERVGVRLGHDVFVNGRLAARAMDAAVEAIAGFRLRMESLGIVHYRAVATSAVRESRNGALFVERLREEAGVELEVITGAEEARLVYVAVRARQSLGRRKWILVDLGGGSVEVSLVDGSGILWSESHTMGSVRLLEELSVSGDEPGRFQRLLREYAATLRIPTLARQWNPAGVIATGGNIEALARLAGTAPAGGQAGSVGVDQLQGAIAMLSRLSFRQRVEQLGLRPDRADVILPAALVYERVAALSGADRIIVPGVGLKDGTLIDLVEDLATHQEHEDRKDRRALEGAVSLGRRYLFDEAHAAHVARLAGSLFDQLAPLHRMQPADRRVLMAAAVLHDIGIFVGHKKHHKHSLYLISQSEIPEFTPREIDLVANLARYHRKGVPAAHHETFTRLPAEDRERVVKLSSLLRIADALDREHLQAVTAVRARVAKSRLSLELEGTGDLLLERWSLRAKADLFTESFGMEVEAVGGGDG